jgi:hypothetical protein
MCHAHNEISHNVLVRVSAGGPACQANSAMCGGIQIGGACSGYPTSGTTVVNNTIVASQGGCVLLSIPGGTQVSASTFRNNLCFQNSPDGLLLNNAGSDNVFSHNHCTTGPGCSVTGDPQFVNPSAGTAAGYQLQRTSPDIDAGYAMGTTRLAADGAPQIHGSAPDIGAWEYGGDATPPDPPPTASGAFWPLNEAAGARTAPDASGHGHELTLSGGVVFGAGYTSAPGLVCTAPPGLAQMQGNFTAPQYTRLGWFLGTQVPNTTSDQLPLTNGGAGGDLWGLHWSLGCPGCNQAVFQQDATGKWWNVQIPGPLKADRWYWIGATYDGTLLRAWLNGHPVAAMAVPSLKTSAGTFTLCGAPWGAPFLGSVDEVKVFPRALSSDEMTQEYLGSVYLPREGRDAR